MVPLAVARCIIVKFLTSENVKPSVIHTRLKAQFGDEMFSRTEIYDRSKLFKEAKQSLKTCKDFTFCRKSYGQHFFFGLSRHLIDQFSDRTTNQ
jgi:hypothetical protein